MMISGGKTKQLDIFFRNTGFTSDFLSFIVVELIRFFHGALQLSVVQLLGLQRDFSSTEILSFKFNEFPGSVKKNKTTKHHRWQKTARHSRGCNDARKLWRVWSNLDLDVVESHPRHLDCEMVRSRLHAVQMICALLLCSSHVSAVDYNSRTYHSGTLHNEHQQPQHQTRTMF